MFREFTYLVDVKIRLFSRLVPSEEEEEDKGEDKGAD
jgi:hypothetical protein